MKYLLIGWLSGLTAAFGFADGLLWGIVTYGLVGAAATLVALAFAVGIAACRGASDRIGVPPLVLAGPPRR